MLNDGSGTRRLTPYGLLVIFLFSLFYCYDYLLQISISVFLPTIKSSFSLTDFQLGLIGSVFFLTYVLLQVPGGYLIDKCGPWKVGLWMSVLCAIGALLMYFSGHSYSVLILSRLFIGLGSSVSFLCAIAIISMYSPIRLFSFFIGVLQALAGVGAMSGQSPIAYLNLRYPWNDIAFLFFLIALVFSLSFLVVMRKRTPLALPQEVRQEKMTLKSMCSILKDRELLYISCMSFISWSPVASLAGFWLVQYLHDVNGMNAVSAGFVISTFWSGLVVGSILIPVISEWNRRRKPILMTSFVLQFLSVILIIAFPEQGLVLSIALFFLGFMSPVQGFCVVLLKDLDRREGFGIASGVINLFGTLSGGVMQLVIGFLLTYVFAGFVNPYAWAFCLYLVFSVLGLWLCLVSYKESHPARPGRGPSSKVTAVFSRSNAENP